MTTAARFQLVTNTTGAALTTAGVTSGDGSDKGYRIIRRNISAADAGAGAGQTQNATGCIVALLPTGLNVLALEATTYKRSVAGPPAQYRVMDNMSSADIDHIANITYWINTTDNTIRVRDNAADASVQIQANDIIVVRLTFGPNP